MTAGAAQMDVAQLVAEHHAALYRYAYRLSGSVADAEDLTQQTFLVAQTKLEQVRSESCVRSWLCTVLRNAWFRSHRKRLPLPAVDLDFDFDRLPDEVPDEPEVDPERLQAALDELPPEFRVVVVMFYFEGLSYRDIAAGLGVPIGTVMSRLSRAKGHLRTRLWEGACHAADRGQGSTSLRE
jgi:RNA polymerase sigma-70 factor (ECF subfamily)